MLKQVRTDESVIVDVYGVGSPHRLMIGGLAFHPNDYKALAETLPGMNIVVHNPLHTGQVEWKEGSLDWLRDQYAKLLTEFACDTMISHSLGNCDAFEVQRRTGFSGNMVCITPPFEPMKSGKNSNRFPHYEENTRIKLDCIFTNLLPADMPLTDYEAILEEHLALYGEHIRKNYKMGMPKGDDLLAVIEKMIDIACQAKSHIRLLISQDDIWTPDRIPERVITAPNIDVRYVKGCHYPHRLYPKEVATHILDIERATF